MGLSLGGYCATPSPANNHCKTPTCCIYTSLPACFKYASRQTFDWVKFRTPTPPLRRKAHVWQQDIEGGGKLGRQYRHLNFVLLTQLDVTGNTVLPATTPNNFWVTCVTAAVIDTHRFRHSPCGKKFKGEEKMKKPLKLCGWGPCPGKMKSTRGGAYFCQHS